MAFFSILLAIFIFIYTLIGLELFSQKVKFNDDDEVDLKNGTAPEMNFDSFLSSLYSVFIVLANDGWTIVYFDYYRGYDPILATVYMISLILIGQYIIFNLFLAILLDNFN